MNVVEYPIGGGATISVQEQPGVLRCFRSFPLSDIIEAIWDCDIPDGDFAKSVTIKCPPGTSLQLIGQYRKPARIAQSKTVLPSKCATHVQSHALTLFPTGAFGAVIVCLRPDAASRIVKAPFRSSRTPVSISGICSAIGKSRCVTTCSPGRGRATSGSPVSRPSCFGS